MQKKANKIWRKLIHKLNNLKTGTTVGLLFFFFVVINILEYSHLSIAGDTAEYINNAFRTLGGEIPYLDFWLLFPPGEVYLPAFLLKIFGQNINVILISIMTTRTIIGVLAFMLGKFVIKENILAIIFSFMVFFLSGNNIYLIFILLSVFFYIEHIRLEKNYLFGVGVLVGLSFLFKLYITGGIFLAFLITITAESLMNKNDWKIYLNNLVKFCSGTILIIGTMMILMGGNTLIMIQETLINAVRHGTSMNLPYLKIIDFIKNTPLQTNFTSFYLILANLNYFFISMVPFLAIASFVLCLRRCQLAKKERIIIIFLFLWSIFTLPKGLARSDLPHLLHSFIPSFLLLIFFFVKLRERSVNNFLVNKKIMLTGILFVIMFIFYASSLSRFYSFASFIRTEPEHEIATPHGTIKYTNKEKADEIRDILSFIEQNSATDDYIFVTPWSTPPIYALTGRKNPTYYDSLIDPIVQPSKIKQEKICTDLKNRNAKIVIHAKDITFDNNTDLSFSKNCTLLQKCIEDNFKIAKDTGNYLLYLPR